ncbi:MAG TPA: HipA family kinase [Burkholderiaceae bacterium]
MSDRPLRTITATRYITPLREGGSLPAIVEADDDGLYVLKFVGAGQGPRALIAELVAGEIARTLGLRVPEIVFARVDAELARTEPDPEIQDLIRASSDLPHGSAGLNLALDYLPGSVTFDPLMLPVEPDLASRIVWFDAFVTNLDRTPRNTNLLVWHGKLWLIDHGAALYFQHDWRDYESRATSPFALVKDHVLLPFASEIERVDACLAALLTPERLAAIVALIPDAWLLDEPSFASKAEHRDAYLNYLTRRLQAPRAFVTEAARAHADAHTSHV